MQQVSVCKLKFKVQSGTSIINCY